MSNRSFIRRVFTAFTLSLLLFSIGAGAEANGNTTSRSYREIIAGQWYTVYPDIVQIHKGIDINSAPSIAQVLGPGRSACIRNYGWINNHYYYKITFDQHLLTGRTSQIGFIRNVRCSMHSTGGTGGGMQIIN